MPPFYGSSYDPAAGFRAATNPYGARRRNPWDLPNFDWRSWRDYFSTPQTAQLDSSPYQYGGVRKPGLPTSPPRSETAFNYGTPTQYADPGQAALYGSTTRPAGYADQPSVTSVPGAGGAAPRAPGAPPTTEEEYWKDRWAMEMADKEAERQQRAYEFDTQQAATRQANNLNAFGSVGQQSSPTGGSAIAQQQAQALDTLAKQRQGVYEQQNVGSAEQAAYQAALAAWSPAAPPPLSDPRSPIGGGAPPGLLPRRGYYANELPPAPPLPKPPPIRPAPFTLDTSPGGSQGTMLGNAGFGIHTDRGGSVRGSMNPQDFEKFQRKASDFSPQGEADWAEYTKFILGDPNERENPNDPNSPLKYPGSPRASILARGEDPGGAAPPAERAYYRALLRRRGSGR